MLSSRPDSKTGMPENIVCPCFSSSLLLLLLLSVNSRHSINASRQTESLLSPAGLKVLPALPPSLGCCGALPLAKPQPPGLAPVNLLSSMFFSLLGPPLLRDFLSTVRPSLSAAGGVAQAQKLRERKNESALGMTTNSSPSQQPRGFSSHQDNRESHWLPLRRPAGQL